MLVHITDERNSGRIKRSGIGVGKNHRAVYFMPVTQHHFISHQWLRELRRSGAQVLVGVYFRLAAKELVWVGKYNSQHRRMPLGEAIRELTALSDPLGYEMFIERKILANEIRKIRHLPQKIGWRYTPHAHGTPPCPCPVCLRRGEYGSRKIREQYDDPEPVRLAYAVVKAKIAASNDIDVLFNCLWSLRKKRRRADPSFLERLFTIDDDELHEEVAQRLRYFRHENTKRMLIDLCKRESPEVRRAAAESLVQIYRNAAVSVLGPLADDPVIGKVLSLKLKA